MTLVGYQCVVDWMGAPVLTLADVWPTRPRIVVVGLNPAPKSVAAGHYYQGKTGRAQLVRLAAAGLLRHPPDEPYFEKAALDAGVGFTDIVKRPTPAEGGVTKAEIEHGRAILSAKLAADEVALVVCLFRQPAKALLGKLHPVGLQPVPTEWGGRVFRMAGPYAPGAEVSRVMGELALLLQR